MWAATSKKSQSKSSNAITDQFPGLSDLDGLKKELAPGPEANKRLAQELAAFAVDGGQVLIGVAEGEPLTLWPVQLKGLPDGSNRSGWPVWILAPHMVDHEYYGRSDA